MLADVVPDGVLHVPPVLPGVRGARAGPDHAGRRDTVPAGRGSRGLTRRRQGTHSSTPRRPRPAPATRPSPVHLRVDGPDQRRRPRRDDHVARRSWGPRPRAGPHDDGRCTCWPPGPCCWAGIVNWPKVAAVGLPRPQPVDPRLGVRNGLAPRTTGRRRGPPSTRLVVRRSPGRSATPAARSASGSSPARCWRRAAGVFDPGIACWRTCCTCGTAATPSGWPPGCSR